MAITTLQVFALSSDPNRRDSRQRLHGTTQQGEYHNFLLPENHGINPEIIESLHKELVFCPVSPNFNDPVSKQVKLPIIEVDHAGKRVKAVRVVDSTMVDRPVALSLYFKAIYPECRVLVGKFVEVPRERTTRYGNNVYSGTFETSSGFVRVSGSPNSQLNGYIYNCSGSYEEGVVTYLVVDAGNIVQSMRHYKMK